MNVPRTFKSTFLILCRQRDFAFLTVTERFDHGDTRCCVRQRAGFIEHNGIGVCNGLHEAAANYNLDNLCAVVDRNRLQISGNTEDVMKLDSQEQRWAAFGWNVISVDGNSIEALDAAFTTAKHHAGTLRMAQDAGLPLSELRADGGPTANKYLMQFQSDIAKVTVSVPDVAELSGFGAACAAGFSCGLYDPETIFANTHRSCFTPEMDHTEREARYNGWQKAVRQALTH